MLITYCHRPCSVIELQNPDEGSIPSGHEWGQVSRVRIIDELEYSYNLIWTLSLPSREGSCPGRGGEKKELAHANHVQGLDHPGYDAAPRVSTVGLDQNLEETKSILVVAILQSQGILSMRGLPQISAGTA
jgi:hypothetical protein